MKTEDIGRKISFLPLKKVTRDQTPSSVSNNNFNIVVHLNAIDRTHWVLFTRRESGETEKRRQSPVYYFDSFGVETPPLFFEEYVDIESDERIQEYDESYCGPHCLYMIYFIDRGFRIESALKILINEVKYPRMCNECLCFNCKDKLIDNININDINNDNDNDNVNDNDNDNANDNVNDKDNDNENDKDNI